jgi:hypothetical protein
MHRCPKCQGECDCDAEDLWTDTPPLDCDHECQIDDDPEVEENDTD